MSGRVTRTVSGGASRYLIVAQYCADQARKKGYSQLAADLERRRNEYRILVRKHEAGNLFGTHKFRCNNDNNKIRDLSPRTNYTDRAAAAGRRS